MCLLFLVLSQLLRLFFLVVSLIRLNRVQIYKDLEMLKIKVNPQILQAWDLLTWFLLGLVVGLVLGYLLR